MLLRQIVCIPLFPPQSCSRRPLPFTNYFWHWKPKIDPKSLVCASGRTYPDVFHLVFKLLSSTKPVNWWLRLACTLSRPESVLVLTRQRVRLPLFSVWSSSRRPLPFTNFFWHRKPKTDPKSLVHRRFRTYVSRCFPSGLAHDNQCFCWYLHFGISSKMLPNSTHLTHKSSDQTVRIHFFPSWSCSRIPSLLTDDFWDEKNRKLVKIECVSLLQYVCIKIFPFGLAHADHCHL